MREWELAVDLVWRRDLQQEKSWKTLTPKPWRECIWLTRVLSQL